MQKTIVHDARLQGIDVPADADKLWIWNGTDVLKTDRDIYAMIGNRRIDTIAGIPASIARVAELTSHVGDAANPHSVTKAQVGLGDVQNIAPANMPLSTPVKD